MAGQINELLIRVKNCQSFIHSVISKMYSNDERTDMLFAYAKSNRNPLLAKNMYGELYPNRRIPNIQMFRRLERNLRDCGAFDRNKTRKCVVTGSMRNQINVLGLVSYKNISNQDCSLREIAHELGISVKSTRNILKKNKYKCYRIRKVHHLNERDYGRRVRFAMWLRRRNREVGNICNKIIWTDESKFTNNGWFNRNIHYRWNNTNEHLHRETNFQERFGINVWLGILGTNILGPFFYDEHLNGGMYLHFLSNEFDGYLDELPLNIRREIQYFQQDGAPPHNAAIVREHLDAIFPRKWIGNNGPIAWPARSPDLTPLDFFVWGYIKDKVFSTTSTDIDHLKQKIRDACNSITPIMLENCHRNCMDRQLMCIQQRGRQFEHLM